MKRPAICLSVCVALVGWAATGHAKRGGGKAAAPAADDNAGGEGGDKAAPAGGDSGGRQGSGAREREPRHEPSEGEPARSKRRSAARRRSGRPRTLTWQDIVVVPRKAFLKGGRLELAPFAGMTVNDNLIRHYMFGVDLNYFLTDVFWVGLQGQYFVKQLTDAGRAGRPAVQPDRRR